MENQLEVYVGSPLTFTLPSGHEVTIREQNGDDDATLSLITKGKGRDQIDNLNRFISSIIIKNGFTGNPYMTVEEVEALRLRDKYYILLKSRIHSLGDEIVFTNTCNDKDCKHEMECTEDLNIFDADLDDFDPKAPAYKFAIKPYGDKGTDKHREFTLTSGKTLRFEYMTGAGEKKALGAYRSDASRNTEMYARSLSIKVGEDWQMLGSMSIFSPKEMAHIRKEIDTWDSQFILASEVECPKCGNEMLIPLNAVQDFFFLAEI